MVWVPSRKVITRSSPGIYLRTKSEYKSAKSIQIASSGDFDAVVGNAITRTGTLSSVLDSDGYSIQSDSSRYFNVNLDINSYAEGTVIWRIKPSVAYNSSTIRAIWGQLSTSSPVPEFSAAVYLDNNFYVGFNRSGDDDRVILAASAANFSNTEYQTYIFTFKSGGYSRLYRNGVLLGSNSGSTNVGGLPTPNNFYIGAIVGYYGTATVDANWSFFGVFDKELDANQISYIGNDPLKIFELRRTWFALGGTGGDVSLALSGQYFTAAKNDFSVSSAVPVTGAQATFSNGTLASLNLASLTGQSSATQQGNLSPQTVLSLLGQAGTLANGTLSATSDILQALTGLSATAAQGAIAAALQTSLSGQSGTLANGTLTPSSGAVQALTGLSASATQGSITAALTAALSGIAASTAQGTLSPLTGILVALTGQQASVVNGAIQAALNAAATGIPTTSSGGTLTGGLSKAISGNEVTSALGSATPFVAVGASGMSIAFSQGNLIVVNSDLVLALTGNAATITQGAFSPGLSKGITGQSISVDQGTLFATLAALPAGQSVTLLQGSATLTLSKNLTGQAIVSGQGALVFSDNNVTLSLTGQEIVTSQGRLYIGGGTWAHTTRVYAGGKNLTVITLNQKGKIIALS